MKAPILTITIILFSFIHSHAQNINLHGRVIDTDNNIIIGATIQCFQHDSLLINGSISDEKGHFSIQLSHKGDYKLKVSYIGYETNTSLWKNIQREINIGDIILTNTSINLHEISITAQQTIHTANKLIIYPTKQQLHHSVGGYEALAHLLIPTLEVDPFKKTISMKEGSVIACINGRQASEEEIKNINSNDIVRIDFYDHGHSAFPDKYAVIDYILKSKDAGGTISMNGEQHLNRATGSYDISGQFFKKKSEVAFYISDAYNNFTIGQGSTSNTQFISPNNILIRKNEILPSKQWSNTVSSYLNYSYKNQGNHFYTALHYNIGKTQDKNNSVQSYNNQKGQHNVQDFSQMNNINPGIELFYNGTFNRKQTLKVTLSSDYNYNKYIRDYSETVSPDQNSYSTNITENYFFLKLFASYAKTFANNGILSTSFIYIQNNSHTEQLSQNATNKKDYLKYGGGSLHFVYQQTIEKVSFRLRWANSMETQKSKNNRTIQRFNLYPQLSFDYRISHEQYLQLVAQYSHDTPRMAWLTDTEQQIDPLQIRRGNPNLKNRHVLQIIFSYSIDKKWATLIPQIAYCPLFNYLYESVIRENNIYVHSYATGGTLQYFRPYLTLKLKLIPQILTIKLNTGWEKQWYTTWRKNSITNWIYNVNLLFMHKDFIASADIYAPTKTLGFGDTTKTPLTYHFNLGYTLRNFNIQFGTRNPFSIITKHIELITPCYRNYTDSYIPRTEDHVFYIKANYRFNFGKKYDFSKPNIENTSKSAILKAY